MNCFAMNFSILARPAALAAVALLTSCGGGGSDTPAVTTLQASPAMFGRTTTVTVQGANLVGTTASIEPGCPEMTRSAGGTDTVQNFTCRIPVMGDLRVRIRHAGGAELAALRIFIPQPQVTFNMAHNGVTGTFTVELDPEKAPITVNNFLAYVNQSTCFYRNTLFHRVEKDLVVQAGGFTTGPVQKTENLLATIPLESNRGLSNLRGTIGMARGSAASSATSQFYINVKDNLAFDYLNELNPGYAVFGRVLDMTDIDRMRNVAVTSKVVPGNPATTLNNVPDPDVVITACGQTK